MKNYEFYEKRTLHDSSLSKSSHALLAVGSSSKNTQLILEKTNMKQYFDAIADGNDIKKSKPDQEVFLIAKVIILKKVRFV